MAIRVRKPGLSTTVQDAGRVGYYDVGIPLSGALDQYSFRVANLLVGNAEVAAVLECTLMGPELEFEHDAVVAIAGATFSPKLDGSARPMNEAFAIPAGGVLTFGYITAGARAYLAVAGGIDVPVILNSRSTYELGAFGGYAGRKLQKDDVLSTGAHARKPPAARALPPELAVPLPREAEIRVVPGLYDFRLTPDATEMFYADAWTVAPEANRIGYRFKSVRPLVFRERTQPFGAGSDLSNIVDAGYPIGSIQAPGGLEPIVVHRDAVSGGGYAMFATVISADMDRIAQLQPNYRARFVAVTLEQALAERAARHRRLEKMRAVLQE